MKQVILVTGAAGFVGSHLAERLLKLGHKVIGLDNFNDSYAPSVKWDNICSLQAEDGFQLEQGDILDTELLTRIFSESRIATVAHLAARAGVRPSLEQPRLYQDVNIGGTVNLLEASRTYGVKQFIFASSSSVYGSNNKAPFSEDLVIDHPVSPYAATKAAGELFCRTYSQLYGLPVVALRFFTVYGPRQRPDLAIHRFTRMIDRGEEVTLFGDGTTSRDYTYIDDIIDGFEAAFDYKGEVFQIFNLGGGQRVELKYLVKLIEDALGKKAKIRNIELQPGDMLITAADITRAKALLGYTPRVSIEKGIPLFVQWYLKNRTCKE